MLGRMCLIGDTPRVHLTRMAFGGQLWGQAPLPLRPLLFRPGRPFPPDSGK
jgi:hypothetical protein